MPIKRRFRIFDLCTPWFWIVVFYRRQYGKPAFEASLYDERGTNPKWWLSRPGWEDEPDSSVGYEAASDG
jgi:hypothetical protein